MKLIWKTQREILRRLYVEFDLLGYGRRGSYLRARAGSVALEVLIKKGGELF